MIIIIGIITYKKELLRFDDKKIILFLVSFFLILIIATAINHKIWEHDSLTKSLIYLRYLIFIVVVSLIIKKNDINFNYFLFHACYVQDFYH